MAAGDDDVTGVTRSGVSLMSCPSFAGGVRVTPRAAACKEDARAAYGSTVTPRQKATYLAMARASGFGAGTDHAASSLTWPATMTSKYSVRPFHGHVDAVSLRLRYSLLTESGGK